MKGFKTLLMYAFLRHVPFPLLVGFIMLPFMAIKGLGELIHHEIYGYPPPAFQYSRMSDTPLCKARAKELPLTCRDLDAVK